VLHAIRTVFLLGQDYCQRRLSDTIKLCITLSLSSYIKFDGRRVTSSNRWVNECSVRKCSSRRYWNLKAVSEEYLLALCQWAPSIRREADVSIEAQSVVRKGEVVTVLNIDGVLSNSQYSKRKAPELWLGNSTCVNSSGELDRIHLRNCSSDKVLERQREHTHSLITYKLIKRTCTIPNTYSHEFRRRKRTYSEIRPRRILLSNRSRKGWHGHLESDTSAAESLL